MSYEPPQQILRWANLPECESPPEGWQVKQFTDIAKVIAGQSPPSETYNQKGDGLPFLQGNADFSFKHPTPKLWCNSPAKIAKAGDTLISVRAPVGEINRADQDYAIGRGLAAIRATNVNSDFIYQGLQCWCWSLQRVAQGTTFDAVTARHFSQLRVAIPENIDEQTAIAGILDAVDTAIERTREVIDFATKFKNALVQDFFYSALGLTAYADRPSKRLPSDWVLLPMEALIAGEPKNGVSPKASSQPPGTPTFSIAAIRDGRIDLFKGENLKYTEISPKVAEKFKISKGDILIVRGNANPDLVGKAGRITDFPDGCIYPDITKRVVLRNYGDHRLLPEFTVLTWNHAIVHNQVLRRAKTSNGTLKINNRDVKQILLPVPPLVQQEEIVDLIETVDTKIDALTAKFTALDQLKKSLMHDLLTGKVRVGDSGLLPPL